MRRQRRCRVCGCGYWPHPRSGKRQHVCAKPECQRERHRASCKDWRTRNPEYDRERRLRSRLTAPERAQEGTTAEPPGGDPLMLLDWQVARDAAGVEVAVIVEESGRLVVQWARDAFHAYLAETTGTISELAKRAPRDALGGSRGPP